MWLSESTLKTKITMQTMKMVMTTVMTGTILSYQKLWSGKEMVNLKSSLEPEKEQDLKQGLWQSWYKVTDKTCIPEPRGNVVRDDIGGTFLGRKCEIKFIFCGKARKI